jgi:hypothetical protein
VCTTFPFSPRNVYGWRARGLEPVRHFCRHAPLKPPTQRDRRYWLDRFTLDEIRELAGAIWPD